jgi:hypothetical protein
MDTWSGRGGGSQLYSSNNICQLHVTNEYSFIFLSAEEYDIIYLSVLYSSVHSSVNQEI